MPNIAASTHGEANLHMLRIVRRGDRHDPRDLTVSCRFEGDFSLAFIDGRTDVLLPGEAVKNLVHTTAREVGGGEIEIFALAIGERVLASQPGMTRARIEVSEQPWHRVEVGGKVQGQAFVAGSAERRTVTVTSNGDQTAVVSGIDNLTVMRTSGFAPSRPASVDPGGKDDGLQRMLVATLSARWTYSSPDVTFGPYRQGVRAAIVETLGCHGRRSIQHTLYSIADVVLASVQEIVEITLTVQERPYRPVDLFSAGMENPDDLFLVLEEPLGIVEVRVER
jgi:urate oxidase